MNRRQTDSLAAAYKVDDDMKIDVIASLQNARSILPIKKSRKTLQTPGRSLISQKKMLVLRP